jgi:hypothetical protein
MNEAVLKVYNKSLEVDSARAKAEAAYILPISLMFLELLSFMGLNTLAGVSICLKFFYSLENGDNLSYFLTQRCLRKGNWQPWFLLHIKEYDNFHYDLNEAGVNQLNIFLSKNYCFIELYEDIVLTMISIFDNLEAIKQDLGTIRFHFEIQEKCISSYIKAPHSNSITKKMIANILLELMFLDSPAQESCFAHNGTGFSITEKAFFLAKTLKGDSALQHIRSLRPLQ